MADEFTNPEKDTLVETEATFTTPRDNLVDPATVTVIWKSPSEVLTTWIYGVDAELTRTSLGIFSAEKVLDEAGLWKVRWEGAGVAAKVVRITVIESDF